MSSASLVILMIGAFIVAVKGLRLIALWRDARGERMTTTVVFSGAPDSASLASDESGEASEDDLGVALALALRDAEGEARGKWSTLDSP